ncbi:zinc-binding dehydrogenase [Thermophilibacter immobilis]|uniref:Zinc-binding dehydrogenase n=2 Tax=Thermophilibacter immobilis TaxID=2779519 RepID=A0A7S7M9H5_9ACTN|nr:zinc-binding dehydrogenase [Thermophilibacter immobilis]
MALLRKSTLAGSMKTARSGIRPCSARICAPAMRTVRIAPMKGPTAKKLKMVSRRPMMPSEKLSTSISKPAGVQVLAHASQRLISQPASGPMIMAPMGLGAITYALHCGRKPAILTVADINQERLDRAAQLFDPATIKAEEGVEVHFANTGETDDPAGLLRAITDGKGYDDVLCYAPVAPVVTLCSAILGRDGCLNFFAGPTDKNFSAPMNFYDVHYNSTHVMGTTGGNTDDMIESLELTADGRLDPAVMVTHIGGLDAAPDATLTLPKIPGGKKLIYTHITLPLIALDELRAQGEKTGDERFTTLADIVDAHNGLWNPEAERFLLSNWPDEG